MLVKITTSLSHVLCQYVPRYGVFSVNESIDILVYIISAFPVICKGENANFLKIYIIFYAVHNKLLAQL